MPQVVRSRSRVISGKKRLVEWSICSVPTGFSNVAAGAKAIAVLVPTATLADVGPGTVVRTRGEVRIFSDQQIATENQIGAFGMGFVNEVAGALGITGLPGPASQCAWGGWFVHQFFSQQMLFATAAGLEDNRGERYQIDSKAMRKFAADENLVFMIENFGSTGLEFGVSFRMLIKAG